MLIRSVSLMGVCKIHLFKSTLNKNFIEDKK
ncbi:hypothetical protein HDEF_2315 [Candidatus Hamiltonella defensa 5AT (Acyrthosiphon pisum)]|uniref:Uncharacterized protein n=1 Tax=Hamiltonella defensa subsp. Acyrthosiphon pisum (strain 5AT) TaxID=572265 RepID=C4K8Y3_HAMD5|nr:hypothetical protein HDEF_2315 [Candidatus Hamiltonella defensa 5AT (Acyrthosiphon pisum)]